MVKRLVVFVVAIARVRAVALSDLGRRQSVCLRIQESVDSIHAFHAIKSLDRCRIVFLYIAY